MPWLATYIAWRMTNMSASLWWSAMSWLCSLLGWNNLTLIIWSEWGNASVARKVMRLSFVVCFLRNFLRATSAHIFTDIVDSSWTIAIQSMTRILSTFYSMVSGLTMKCLVSLSSSVGASGTAISLDFPRKDWLEPLDANRDLGIQLNSYTCQ